MKVFLLAGFTFQEARQRRLVWIGALLGLLFLGVFAAGFYFMYQDISRHAGSMEPARVGAANTFSLIGLYAIQFLGIMLAVVVSVDSIAGEIGSGTIQAIVTKPVRRWEVVVGKWLGLWGLLALFILIMSGGIGLIAWSIAGHIPPNFLRGVSLMLFASSIVLTISLLGSTRLSALANGVLVLMLYGLTFAAGWIEEIGAVLRNQTAVDIGVLVSFLMPAEAMWKRAAYLMQPALVRELDMGGPFGGASAPSQAMVIYAGLYLLVMLGLAVRSFRTRDL